MKCPHCRSVMYVAEIDGVELDLCADCRGIWFDRGELDLLLGGGGLPQLAGAETAERPRSCPLCRRRMVKLNIGPEGRVLVDSCPAGCGLWFDDRELSELVDNLARDGWRLPPPVLEFLGRGLGGQDKR